VHDDGSGPGRRRSSPGNALDHPFRDRRLLMNRLVAVGSALALAAVLVGPLFEAASGTTLIRRSTEELTVLSEAVVEGRVQSIEAKWHEEHRFVYTYVTIAVDEIHKGRIEGSTVVLQELGGSANGITATVPSTPEFALGERVIVFLDVVNGYYRCHGFAQGKFHVEQTAAGVAVTRPEEIELTFGRDADGQLDSTVDAASGIRPYDRFVGTIAAWADRLTLPRGDE
jgi:hypothetical protein